MTTKEVADMLSVSTEQVRIFANRHNLPHYRLSPRCIRFKKDDIIKWTERRLLA
ncbi:helix-turn-helix domain-containing protein [Veillonella montpellierensis]|uniref:helix-turn-helix domain-containing protein n=1 Tax=Veillonella montpellierensis TaxID=187328 RepID=UPI001E4BC089|nr:helix-turn-helix domain-containing protein [Veillonella montpellierensis]